MNIFAKLTAKTLQKNKTRTLVTIVGIILSASMITAIATLITSFQSFMTESYIYQGGDWHVWARQVLPEDEAALLKAAGDEKSVVAEDVGYARLSGSQNEYKPYLFIQSADENFFSSMPVHLSSGRLPQSPNEIILPDHLRENGGVAHILGEVITLEVGERIRTSDGLLLNQSWSFTPEEEESIRNAQKHTYTVVGFYERPDFEYFSAPGYTALTVGGGREGLPKDFYFNLENPRDANDFYSALSEAAFDKSAGNMKFSLKMNSDLLMFYGVSGYESFYAILYSLSAILMALIMFASVSLIYNAFAVSVSSRTKQFGLLSSIGATKKQLRKTILWEALFVSVAGIPLGILCGIGGIGVTLHFIGDKLQYISVADGVKMKLVVSPAGIIIACVISLITVLISAYIPSKRATKVSAIDAIRGSKDIKIKEKAIKSSPLTYKLLGFEGMLAQKYFRRNKRQYRPVILSLFMSVVLFVSANSFTTYMTKSINEAFNASAADIVYDFYADDKNADESAVFGQIKNVDSVDSAVLARHLTSAGARIDKSYASKQATENLGENVSTNIFAEVFVLDADSFEKYAAECGAEGKIGENDAIISDYAVKVPIGEGAKKRFANFSVLSSMPESLSCSYTDYSAFGNMELSDEEYKELEKKHTYTQDIPLGFKTEKLPYGFATLDHPSAVYVFVSESSAAAKKMLATPESFASHIYIGAENYNQAFEKIKSIITENALSAENLYNFAEERAVEKNFLTVVKVLSYGFITLITLIVTANIFNTVSTNIALRSKEFAMLRSVGITKKGMRKIMAYECSVYSIKALLYGLPVSAAVTLLIFLAVNQGWETSFIIPWSAVLTVIIGAFAVTAVTMIYAITKIEKENPVDALKNDNI